MSIALLEHGADITLKNDEGKRPADLAADKGFSEIAEILRDDD
jgi:ankyrin repeat protein